MPTDPSLVSKKCQFCRLSFDCQPDWQGPCPRCAQVMQMGIEIRFKHPEMGGQGSGSLGAITKYLAEGGQKVGGFVK